MHSRHTASPVGCTVFPCFCLEYYTTLSRKLHSSSLMNCMVPSIPCSDCGKLSAGPGTVESGKKLYKSLYSPWRLGRGQMPARDTALNTSMSVLSGTQLRLCKNSGKARVSCLLGMRSRGWSWKVLSQSKQFARAASKMLNFVVA